MTNSPFPIICCHFKAILDSVCARLAINQARWRTGPDNDILATVTSLTNEMAHGTPAPSLCWEHFLNLHCIRCCVATLIDDDEKLTPPPHPAPPANKKNQEQSWNMVIEDAKRGNLMCSQMTSNSSTRAFNEITSLNEHWERVKSEQWLFRVV